MSWPIDHTYSATWRTSVTHLVGYSPFTDSVRTEGWVDDLCGWLHTETVSPIPTLTEINVEQLHWSKPTVYRHAKPRSCRLACNSRLRSAIRRPRPPQRPVLDHIHCFRQCEIVGSQILLYGAQPCDAGASSIGLLQSSGGRVYRILLASVLSSIRAMCPKRVRRRDWTIAVSLGCPVSLRTSSFRTKWCHFIPGSIRRHH